MLLSHSLKNHFRLRWAYLQFTKFIIWSDIKSYKGALSSGSTVQNCFLCAWFDRRCCLKIESWLEILNPVVTHYSPVVTHYSPVPVCKSPRVISVDFLCYFVTCRVASTRQPELAFDAYSSPSSPPILLYICFVLPRITLKLLEWNV